MISLTLLLLLLACDVDSASPADCASLDQVTARDTCRADRIAELSAEQAARVLADAREIRDPMLRGAVVSRWVEGHAGDLPTDRGQALCDLLSQADRAYCLRRLSSPHLQ